MGNSDGRQTAKLSPEAHLNDNTRLSVVFVDRTELSDIYVTRAFSER